MNRHDLFGIAIIGAVASVLLSGFGAHYYLTHSPARDFRTGCLIDRPAPHTVVVIDRTDPLVAAHAPLLLAMAERAERSLGIEERLSIFEITGDTTGAAEPLFSICKPADGADADELYQNPRMMKAHYQKVFAAPLSAVIAAEQAPAEAPVSPILESIRRVTLLPTFRSGIGQRRLIILSDFLQNVPAYSQYRTAPDYDRFRETAYGRSVRADLTDVTVQLVYLSNPAAIGRQTPQHVEFWQRYFADMGATKLEIVRP